MPATATYQLLDGRACSDALKQRIAVEAAEVLAKRGRAPHLAAVLVGDDGASRTYVEAKVKACEAVGFRSSLIRLPAAFRMQATILLWCTSSPT